jgi:hypothetical protein
VYSKGGWKISQRVFEVGKVKERFGAQKRVLKLECEREIWSSEERVLKLEGKKRDFWKLRREF